MTSNAIIDLATGFSFFGLTGWGFGCGASTGAGTSPNKSSSSAAGSGFFSYFFYCAGFWAFFPLKALWAYFGRSLDPTVLSVAATPKYQDVVLAYAFLYYSPKTDANIPLNATANEISAMLN